MRKLLVFCAVLLVAVSANVWADGDKQTIVVTATNNATANQLLVYNTAGQLIQTLATGGQGGVGGNAGGIETSGGIVAVVNFGSINVSLFKRSGNGLVLSQPPVATASNPVSVAFANAHLYVLGTTKIESHPIHGSIVQISPDGVVPLLKADGTAAQVGVVPGQLIITEKSNVIETVGLSGGAVTGTATLVQNIPANVNAPFGLVTQGNDAYVTIAHADEISLVRSGTVLTTTLSVTQHAPCWLAIVNESVGTFVYSSNSPSMSISRYAVYGQKIVQDLAVAAQLGSVGSSTDIAAGQGLLAVIDGNGTVSHLSVYNIDEDGNLTFKSKATAGAAINGVAIVGGEDRDD